MAKKNHDPSIENEPHLKNTIHSADPSELIAYEQLNKESKKANRDEAVEHTVWDEPTLSKDLAGSPEEDGRLTYAKWLEWKLSTTPVQKTWWVVFLVMLSAGPFGILGAMMGPFMGSSTLFGLLSVTVIGPVTEEMVKIAVALWVIEKKPYLFRMPFQVLLCTAAGGLAFATIENLVYLNIYIPKSKQDISILGGMNIVQWRWSVCTALHVVCSSFAGLGLAKMWSYGVANLKRPNIKHAAPMIIAAMIGHGLYNGIVTLMEMVGVH